MCPQFYAEHVPSDLDDFTTGYLEAVEWLLDEEVNRSKIRGFSRKALANAKADCKDFQEANSADLAIYSEVSGRDMGSAGHDFYLTRCGHGTGFWDRGNDPVFKRLSKASKVGEVWSDVYRGWIQLS